MKAMLTGFCLVAVIGLVSWYGLGMAGFSSANVNSSDSVRLD